MLELFPEGFEERSAGERLELTAYGEGAAARLAGAFGDVEVDEVADDWAERWRAFHRPVEIGPLWVGPPWLEPPPGALAVVIEPAQAFGTGAHPTTRLCLELLLGIAPGSLLDVGCGSGVLAIAAGKLGFGPLTALDHDPAAVEAARANAAANGVPLSVACRDALAGDELPAADLTLANIALEPVEAIAPRVRSPLLVAAGYLEREAPAVPGFVTRRRLVREGWAADLLAQQ